MLQRIAVFIAALSFAFPALAQSPQPTAALTFQAWKDQQVLEAQNQVLRASSHIVQVRAAKPGSSDSKETAALPSSRVKKAGDGDQVALADKDLKRAQESLEAAGSLQLEDYIAIYLPSLQDQPEAAAKLVEKLTKEELAEITKGLIRKGSKLSDTKRNARGITVEPLTVSAGTRTN